ncbi:MAG: RnfABCDGE type electron transport complex subunit C [Bacilli bacterium]|nr:RnfABCDGE type electron transport complex subunit C [Bacilli bacterium]
MGILASKGSRHINGHKELTKDVEVEQIFKGEVVKNIYIPVVNNSAKEHTLLVKEGDGVCVGTKLAVQEGFLYVPVYSPVSGKVIGKENRYSNLIGRSVPHLVIENDFKYTEGEKLPTVTLETATRENVVNLIKEAGIIGQGGAGFPTFIKYENVENLQTLIINGCECEPYLTTDYTQGIALANKVVSGTELLLIASGAKQAKICIKHHRNNPLKQALEEAIKGHEKISLFEVKDIYPIGWERVLIKAVTHKEYDRLPSEIGVVVNNLQTAISVSEALLEGKTIRTRVVTISGDGVATNKNVCVPVGTPVNKIVEHLGGYTSEEVSLLAGGPMTSKAQMKDEFVVERQTGGITVLKYHKINAEPCLGCGECTLHCPAHLQPVEIVRAVKADDINRIKALNADKCIECGMCSYSCPSHIDVTEYMRKAKLKLRIAAAKANPKK